MFEKRVQPDKERKGNRAQVVDASNGIQNVSASYLEKKLNTSCFSCTKLMSHIMTKSSLTISSLSGMWCSRLTK